MRADRQTDRQTNRHNHCNILHPSRERSNCTLDETAKESYEERRKESAYGIGNKKPKAVTGISGIERKMEEEKNITRKGAENMGFGDGYGRG